MKILIIENDSDSCTLYRDILQGTDAEIAVCHTAEKALHLLIHFQPDAVLLNWDLPKAAGEVIMGFIHKYPRLSNARVVLISNDAQLASHVARYWKASASLGKPITQENLYDALGIVNSQR
jgi:DNA-binding response OmpR family regulator